MEGHAHLIAQGDEFDDPSALPAGRGNLARHARAAASCRGGAAAEHVEATEADFLDVGQGLGVVVVGLAGKAADEVGAEAEVGDMGAAS